jgi:hypothetical protein
LVGVFFFSFFSFLSVSFLVAVAGWLVLLFSSLGVLYEGGELRLGCTM